MYVFFAAWNGPFSLACLQVLIKSEPAACRSHYLFYPFVLGSQTAGKVRQVHPFLLAQGSPF